MLSDWLSLAWHQASAMSLWEALAVALSLAYLLLAMRRSLWCWPAALISTLIYIVLFWKVALLMESLLNVYYLVMAVYGFWLWSSDREVKQQQPIIRWSVQRHLLLIVVTALVSWGCGAFMAHYTRAQLPYLDAATSCFAVVNTYLVARKELYNWLYWIVIDGVSAYLYAIKGLPLTSGLSMLYVILVINGFFDWLKVSRQQQAEVNGQFA